MNNLCPATGSTHRRGKTPSFSSILLDSIYRSIDLDVTSSSSPTHNHHQPTTTTTICKEHLTHPPIPHHNQIHPQNQRRTEMRTGRTMKSQTTITTATATSTATAGDRMSFREKPVNLRGAIMIEHWMEKYQQEEEEDKRLETIAEDHRHDHNNKGGTRVLLRQMSVPNRKRQAVRRTKGHFRGSSLATNIAATTRSSSSSLESFFYSGPGNCSSSTSAAAAAEADSYSCFTPQIPLKIRTTFAPRWERTSSSPAQKRSSSSDSGREGKFMARTKSRALKIYGELKKAKRQHARHPPISPGAKIASFLSSMFAANKKKQHQQRNTAAVSDPEVRSGGKPNHSPPATSSSCSSGSSFSRSCLSSKTASSSGGERGEANSKRSVRFYPVSVIVDEDPRFCGHRCVEEDEQDDEENLNNLNQKQIRIRPIFDSTVKSAQMRVDTVDLEHEEEEIGDGEESYASSDLFELENLNSLGIGTMMMRGDDEELPLYGTTSVEQNQAIAASGFLV